MRKLLGVSDSTISAQANRVPRLLIRHRLRHRSLQLKGARSAEGAKAKHWLLAGRWGLHAHHELLTLHPCILRLPSLHVLLILL
jgi:hypothetical protein